MLEFSVTTSTLVLDQCLNKKKGSVVGLKEANEFQYSLNNEETKKAIVCLTLTVQALVYPYWLFQRTDIWSHKYS